MIIIKIIILSIIQGFTEPLPISSSGHLVIVSNIINDSILQNQSLPIILNFASFIAIFIYFRKDILNLINGFFKFIFKKDQKHKSEFNYSLKIVYGTIPAVIIGFLFKDLFDEFLQSAKIVGFALLITALFLYIIKDKTGSKDDDDISVKDAFVIGLFQAVALVPGISRSGSTVVGALLCDLKRKAALKFSFMLYLPISLASLVLEVTDIEIDALLIPYIIGMIICGVVTYYSTRLFLGIVEKGKLIYFSYYCIIVGILTLIFI